MKKRIVVHSDDLPFNPPTSITWLLAISVAIWNWPGWLLGILWSIVALLWISWFIDKWNAEPRRVFPKPPQSDRDE